MRDRFYVERSRVIPWYVEWTRGCCYTHLVLTLISVIPTIITLVVISALTLGAGLPLTLGAGQPLTLGIGLPLLAGYLACIPLTFLPGFIGLLLCDMAYPPRRPSR